MEGRKETEKMKNVEGNAKVMSKDEEKRKDR